MGRKKYDLDFKLKVVKEALETGNNAAVGRRHEIHGSLVSKWVHRYQEDGENGLDGRKSKPVKHSHLYDPKKHDQLERENDTLKKLLGEKDLEINILRDLLKKGTNR